MRQKLIVVLVALLMFFMVGCSDDKKEKLIQYENAMEEYSKNYYETYIGGIPGLNILEVSINMLENANTVGGSNYDLTVLSDCAKTSKTKLYLTEDGTVIKKYEHKLDCD